MASNEKGFDYSALDEETCAVIQACTREIQSRLLTTAEQMIEIGLQLQIVKEKLKHGQFQAWLLTEFNMNPRQARRIMLVAKQFKTDKYAVLRFASSALYLLAERQTPDTAKKEALHRAEKGEHISWSTAKEIVARHKANTGENTPVSNETKPVKSMLDKEQSVYDIMSEMSFTPSVFSVLAEIQTPNEARQEAIERADQGEKITLRLAKKIVARHKASAEEKSTMLDTSTSQAPRVTGFEEIEAEQRAEHAIIDIPAVTIPDEPIGEPVLQLFKVGDRIRIIRRQHGADDWTGSTATIWEVTTDGWLRVNVEGRDGVKFTLHPDWVELIQEPTMTASNQTEAEIVEPHNHQLHVRIPLEIEGKTIQVTGVINEVEVQYTHEGRTGTVRVPANKVVFPKTGKR